ncbi:MAG: bifunctional (p)ppGpp synthetase/guanosine-3',5'-bis(diphosphate) 3'-pyrophosphohydrolase [Rubrivivax sp.]|nr:bifunctional (p)ppGpp synthetase/guanosine-3',5'-bis(diphosphate) 3'-pyrophosphohydrolase [Rubrivivax sp.]
MKTAEIADPAAAAAIVQLAGSEGKADGAEAGAAADLAAPDRARAFAEPLIGTQLLDTGENALAHADGVAALLRAVGAAPTLCASAYLVYAGDYLQRPEEVVAKAFGPSYASLVELTRKLVQIQRAARRAHVGPEARAEQTERVRKMLLAFSRDLRVVLLRLASRLQTLRWHAASRTPCPRELAEESMQVFAPLANRLGIWQIKWEIEDLAFRFLEPDSYKRIATLLHESRAAREAGVAAARESVARLLAEAGIAADVQGRPKHLYSIWKKMQGKRLRFEQVFDVRALRVIVADTAACYAALARVQAAYTPLDGEFDDYIARPKPNGYQSLHTVVRLADDRPLEIQIRTRAMHEHAEHGVAAHWMYKEAGAKGYAGQSGLRGSGGSAAGGDFEERIAEARKAVLRELLAWERDVSQQAQSGEPGAAARGPAVFDDRIYVFTPQATIIELPAGATPVDFAYAVHSDLGHRCRGARVDGALVPLNTVLANGQTVEITVVREGGPSMDWLNPELGYLKSPRSRAKVRAWFNAQALQATVARGREAVERLLQREGRTAVKLDWIAEQLGFKRADDLFEVVGKDEFSLRSIETLLRPAEPAAPDDAIALRRPRSDGRGGVLVVGVESLMTTLARCCRPAPPDAIVGFVTRGKGVAIHRRDCANFRHMAETHGERVIDVEWGVPEAKGGKESVYPLDVSIEAADRPALLRDVSEVFAKEKMNVIGVKTISTRDADGRTARMTFTVEAPDAAQLTQVLAQITRVPGVRHARRR